MTIKELENGLSKKYFKGEIQLDECTLIIDVEKFIKSHLSTLKSNPGNKTYMPYYNRLIKLLEK